MDVIELRQFYASPLGRQVRRVISRHLNALPRPPADACVLGLGFATPWLDAYRQHVRATLAFMPAHQGAMIWPHEQPPATALVDETALPLPDSSIDLALVVHALELTPVREKLMGELWRVVAPSGHVVFIVPNRSGLWARAERVPFGHGRPFSRRQLEQLLKDSMFTPTTISPLLFMPPWRGRFLGGSAGTWEQVGKWLFPGFSGLLMAQAIKQVYARRGERQRVPLIPALHPAPVGTVGLNMGDMGAHPARHGSET